MKTWVIFLLLSIPVVLASRRSLLNTGSHGFPRFFAWEALAWLLASNYSYWFDNPFSIPQLFSWLLLFGSIYPAVTGFLLLRQSGRARKSERGDDALFGFEQTTRIVQSGIYRYIRHPLYLSLIMMAWGILLKHITLPLIIAAAAATVLLYFTARRDEQECLRYFGSEYAGYMQRTKMFVPRVI